jgi:inorganic pyrophosphatase
MGAHPYAKLSTFVAKSHDLNVVVESPRGSRTKVALDHRSGLFKLKAMLPAGFSFPFDFGSIPRTLADDGDPLDVLVLMEEPTFPGCLVEARLIGVIEARQTEDGETLRNDRLLAVARASRTHGEIEDLGDLAPELLEQIETFFTTFSELRGKSFERIARRGAKVARKLVERGIARFEADGAK